MSDTNDPQQPKVNIEAVAKASERLFDSIPRKAQFAIESVLQASMVFAKNPTRETADNYSHAAAKAARSLRTMAGSAQAERQEASTALEQLAEALKGVSTALVGVDHTNIDTITPERAAASDRAAVPMRAAEQRFAVANQKLLAAFFEATQISKPVTPEDAPVS